MPTKKNSISESEKKEEKKPKQDVLIDNRGHVEPLSIVEEMQSSYID
jgi:hypothetical protein